MPEPSRLSWADEPFIHVTPSSRGPLKEGRDAYLGGYPTTPGGSPGVFAMWQWDGTRLVARSDRLGLGPLFIWRRGREVALSPSPLALVERFGGGDVDARALAVFLRMGFFVGDDTPFQRVRAFPPNGRLEWCDGQVSLEGGYSWGPALAIDRGEALERFSVLFRRAVEARIPASGRVVLPLSGGRDSRHILFELARCGALPHHCVTVPRYPPHPAEDERVAGSIAAAVGVPHVVVAQRDRFPSELSKNRQTSLGSEEHAWFMPLVDHLSAHADVVYDGLGGSLYVGARFTNRATHDAWTGGRHAEVAGSLLDRFALATEPALLATLPASWRRRLSRDVAAERLEAEVALHSHAPDPAKSFHAWTRLRRALALVPFSLLRSRTVFAPLVDEDLYDLMSGLPAAVVAPTFSRRDKTFHDEALARTYPAHAHLPFERSDASRLDASRHRRRFAVQAARHVAAAAPMFVRRVSTVTRLLRCGADRRYSGSMSWLPALAVYLADLGQVCRMMPADAGEPLAEDAR